MLRLSHRVLGKEDRPIRPLKNIEKYQDEACNKKYQKRLGDKLNHFELAPMPHLTNSSFFRKFRLIITIKEVKNSRGKSRQSEQGEKLLSVLFAKDDIKNTKSTLKKQE